jgi:hypothetical protein
MGPDWLWLAQEHIDAWLQSLISNNAGEVVHM